MPRKMTADMYGNSVCYDDNMMKEAPAISFDDHIEEKIHRIAVDYRYNIIAC
jgi:hypothetical protein